MKLFFLQHEKRRQLETQRVITLQLMLDAAATSGNKNNITSLQTELANAERRLKKLQESQDQVRIVAFYIFFRLLKLVLSVLDVFKSNVNNYVSRMRLQ